MTIFVRTNQGQESAYKTESVLPRKLRSILKLIDGKTTLRMFEQNLKSFGDVRSIFYSLAEAGLIRVLPKGAEHVRVNMHLRDAEQQGLMEPSIAGDWLPTPGLYTEHSQPAYGVASSRSPEQNFRLSDTQAVLMDEKKAYALKAVVDDMSAFVLMHLPDQSFELLKEIEEITSIQLLAVTLGGYAQMVSHLGPVSDVHLKHIKRVVSENM